MIYVITVFNIVMAVWSCYWAVRSIRAARRALVSATTAKREAERAESARIEAARLVRLRAAAGPELGE